MRFPEAAFIPAIETGISAIHPSWLQSIAANTQFVRSLVIFEGDIQPSVFEKERITFFLSSSFVF